MPKPGSSRYLTFATIPLLSNFIGKLNFSCKLIYFCYKLFVRIIFFEYEANFSLTYFKNPIEFKNSDKIYFKLCKISTFNMLNCLLLCLVILHK